jgi:hypothetical protein
MRVVHAETREGPCPDNEPFRILQRLLGPLNSPHPGSSASSGNSKGKGKHGSGSGAGNAADGGVQPLLLPLPLLYDFSLWPPTKTVVDSYATGRGPLFRCVCVHVCVCVRVYRTCVCACMRASAFEGARLF